MIIKICGIRDMEAAQAVAKGADMMGFIMSNRFWRYAEPATVKKISQQIASCTKVGVFVDEPLAKVAELARECHLDMVQLHGHESSDYAQELKKLLSNSHVGIIKAFRYGDDFALELADDYPADMVLVDSYSRNSAGGSGAAFAWHKAAETIRQMRKPYLIAGGINKENIRTAEKIFHPYGLDVSSALERDKRKDPQLIGEFLKEAGKL